MDAVTPTAALIHPLQSPRIRPNSTESTGTPVCAIRWDEASEVINQSSSGSSLIDDNERCRRLGRGLRRWGILDDVGLDEREAHSSLSADVDDDGEDGEELYMIYGSLSS